MGSVGTLDGLQSAGGSARDPEPGATGAGHVQAARGPLTARRRFADLIATSALLATVGLPLAEMLTRSLMPGLMPGSAALVQHLTLLVAFLGAMLAARDDRLLALATTAFLPARLHKRLRGAAAFVTVTIVGVLAWSAAVLVVSECEVGDTIGESLPIWLVISVLPIALAVIGGHLVWRSSDSWRGRMVAGAGLGAAIWLVATRESLGGAPAWPLLAIIIGAAALGAPLFAVLGGIAAALLLVSGEPTVQILIESYSLTTSPTLAAIPLFTLAGFLLAEGQASSRLLGVFRAWFGWLPGGTAMVTVAVCSFFTVFTGGSGVTILALGGLLFPALRREGYGDRFSLGLLTASGSVGLLLPPALPLILFAVVAELPMEDVFLGGLLPGAMMSAALAALCVRESIRTQVPRAPFHLTTAIRALLDARWELLLPVIVVTSIFSGVATAVESAALTAGVVLGVQWLWKRELTSGQVLRATTECVTVVGGVLLILGMAVGLSSYLVSAQVPMRLVAWTEAHIHSPLVFLLALNIFLLAVGCVMDIFSATVVVVPLILPLGAAYGIHPVHLGIIFVANLELGYLTPPVGLNLFLSSYRFERPMLEVAKASLPMLAVLGAVVLLVTYAPWLTLGILDLVGRR